MSTSVRFRGTSPRGRLLRSHAPQIRDLVAAHGGDHVRVFGSIVTGAEGSNSDVDLLLCMRRPLSLMELGRLEQPIAELLGTKVDLVPEEALRPDLRRRVLEEAVAL